MVTRSRNSRREDFRHKLASAACVLVLSGCGPRYVQLGENRPAYTREEGRNLGARLQSGRELDVGPLRKVADTYLGIPYLLGGETTSGIDCSAFSQQVFRKTYGLELPRKAAWQGAQGVPVFKFGLQPGDLVFFGTNVDSVEHVGIYMGEGKFINATSSSGVKYSSLDESYWLGRYLFARRMPNLRIVDSLRR